MTNCQQSHPTLPTVSPTRHNGGMGQGCPAVFCLTTAAAMLYLMSTTVIPPGADGTWTMTTITPEQAAELAANEPFVSAVGHDSSAEAMTAALGVPVKANRIAVVPKPRDRFLCLRLLGRAPEGVVLDRAGLDAIGFAWVLLEYHTEIHLEHIIIC